MSLLGRLMTRHGAPPQAPFEDYLRAKQVRFSLHHHREPAYTAQDLAQIEHIPGRMVAKVVIVIAEDRPVMLCLPAPFRVNMLRLMNALGTDNIRLAREDEFACLFSDCEVGAMPPFGNKYGMPVWVDRTLAEGERIVFQAGTHTDTVEMEYLDFARLARPVMADLCSPESQP
jgi:Ala-tRNA(Pro) deacylase